MTMIGFPSSGDSNAVPPPPPTRPHPREITIKSCTSPYHMPYIVESVLGRKPTFGVLSVFETFSASQVSKEDNYIWIVLSGDSIAVPPSRATTYEVLVRER